MNRRSETAYRVRLPGSERICIGAQEVTELLRVYLQARPDDATLSRAAVYELTDVGQVASGPLRLDRFVPESGPYDDS